MDPRLVALAIIGILIVAGMAALWAIARYQGAEDLREFFKTESDNNSQRAGVLVMEPEARVETSRTRHLQPQERDRFVTQWRAVQSSFVDQPRVAAESADSLVHEVMTARGYSTNEAENRAVE